VNNDKDFLTADAHDSEQPPKDRSTNASLKFTKSPQFSVADLNDRSRARTYACCFSLENSASIWTNYGNGSETGGKVCIVFDYSKLRETLNKTFRLDIFNINYGMVEYVELKDHQENQENQIRYTYLKDKEFQHEKRCGFRCQPRA
jgi:hypothetical protein